MFKALEAITIQRDNILDELSRKFNKVNADLEYLTEEKLTLLRNQIMTPEEVKDEEARLRTILEEVKAKMEIKGISASNMLQCVLSFSELVKKLSFYFKHAFDSEKRMIITKIFTELKIFNENVEYEAKQGFNALLRRSEGQISLSGAGGGSRTHTSYDTRF